MAVKHSRVDSTAPRALDELDQIRLDNDWSYRELSEDMTRAGCPVADKTLQTMLRRRTRQPWDRTLHKIRRYLESRRASSPARRRKGAAA